jgi:hypothetical protein
MALATAPRRPDTVRATGNPLQTLTTDAFTVKDFLKTVKGPIVLVGTPTVVR